MKCLTLTGFEKVGKTTRSARFLADMENVFPWPELVAAVLSVYPKISEHGGRPPIRGADAADLLPAFMSVKNRSLAHSCLRARRLVDIAINPYSATKTGNMALSGATGALLVRALDALRSLPDRILTEIRQPEGPAGPGPRPGTASTTLS
jgi:hypothetical protein